MDLGVFKRHKATFWAWIVLPALAVVVVHNALNMVCSSIEGRLQRRQAILSILDQLQDRMTLAKDVVCAFAAMGNGQSAAEDISTRIGELGRRHRFMINSLRVQQAKEDKKKKSANDLIIALQGEGDMVAVMQFLNELQSPQYLTLLDEATMQLKSGSGGGALYKLDLNIRCFSDTLGGRDDE